MASSSFVDLSPKKTICGIVGHAGSGKSTACLELLSILPSGKWKRAGFAFKIKSMIADFGGVEVSTLDTTEGKAAICPFVEENGKPVTFARVLQIQGMVFRERLGYAVWIRACLDKPNRGNIIIEDVRFPNEVDEIHKRGGIIIKLVNPSDPSSDANKKLLAGRDPKDPSESYIDSIVGDYTIVNDVSGGKQVLHEKLEHIVKVANL